MKTTRSSTLLKTLAAAAAVCALALPAGAQGKKVDLKFDLPPPVTVGTPLPIKIPAQHLEPESTPNPVIQVPEGTTNLAKHKPVTSSDKTPIVGELNYVTDGDKDGDEGYEVELAPGVQWVQIDLGKTADLHAVLLWHFHRQKRAYHSVIVQISNDAEFKKDVTTVFNSDYENRAGLGVGKDKVYIETNRGKLIPVNAVKGRYVRLYSAGNTSNVGNHYVEVEVFGKPCH
ncbi:MAG: discoidin domain-containing protein [Puniceicoccales bacterium]|jgi:hypothetical protein|nr:discoidin domain-containing protein [Puniceicoccales bacterium]